MDEFIITDNSEEKITLKWDGERWAVIGVRKIADKGYTHIVVLNPREAHDISEAIRSVEAKEYHEGGRK